MYNLDFTELMCHTWIEMIGGNSYAVTHLSYTEATSQDLTANTEAYLENRYCLSVTWVVLICNMDFCSRTAEKGVVKEPWLALLQHQYTDLLSCCSQTVPNNFNFCLVQI